MSNRPLHTKLSKRRTTSYIPSKMEGKDGDIQIITLKKQGTYLCIKDNNDWKISQRFNPRYRFNKHSFNDIKTTKIYGKSNLALSISSESKAVFDETVTSPIISIGDGTTGGTISSLGSTNLVLKNGKTNSPQLILGSKGTGTNIHSVLQGTSTFNIYGGNGVEIKTSSSHLKLLADADIDDYATLSVADTGDLTIATVGDGTTDSDLKLDADGDIILEAAGGNVTSDAPLEISSTSTQLKLTHNSDDYATLAVADTGDLTIATIGDGSTDSDLTLDADGTVYLDAGISTGNIDLKKAGTSYGLFSVHHSGSWLRLYENGGASTDDYLDISVKANGETSIITVDGAAAAGNLILDPDGELNLTPVTEVKSDAPFKIKEAASAVADTAAYGQMWVKTATPNELWFTNDAGNDIPISLQPFIKTAQFQDDLGTAQHYIPFNNLTEQSSSGTENLGFIAPFNMKLQKVVVKCSEDISGATVEIGMWAIDDGSATNHHGASGQNNIDVTGGTAHTNAVADFTGTVGLATSGSGGSNAITAGQFVDLSIQLDSDETSSSAEFWITCYFLADLTSTI